jgi:hypothetical protein
MAASSMHCTVRGSSVSTVISIGKVHAAAHLLNVLHNTVAQLLVVEPHYTWLVQRQQCFCEKQDVLMLQRFSKAIDDATENLKQLAYAVVPLRLIHKPARQQQQYRFVCA